VIEPAMGETLADRLSREGRLEPGEVLDLARNLSEALEAIHAAGVIHRGLHSDCVVLRSDGKPCLTGFHYSRQETVAGMTAMTSIAYRDPKTGTDGVRVDSAPPHPAPEQILGQPADGRSDLFSLAWMLFECLTGRPPFEDSNPFAWVTPADPAKLVSEAPSALTRSIVRCLSKDPSKRLETARALRRELESNRTEAKPGRLPVRISGSRGWLFGAAAILTIVLAVFLGRGLLPGSSGSRGLRPSGSHGGGPKPPGAVLTSGFETSHAFLIGIGEAKNSGFAPLSNAEGDVQALADALRASKRDGWQITTLLGDEATRERIIESMAELANQTGENDRVFIYYAGHGQPHERSRTSAWIIPADARPDAQSSWVHFDDFFRFFTDAQAKHILVAMDCCYGGRLSSGRSGQAKEFERRFLTRRAHVVIASGRSDEQVFDGVPGEHSPFTRALLQTLAGSGPLTSSMLFSRIQTVFIEWDVPHTPQLGNHPGTEPGEFVFFRDE
jgi:hypothetical protein